MMSKRILGTLFALTIVGAIPAEAEASFAAAIGSSYGGTLRRSSSTRTQQLTADPVTVLRGSTSTEYDPHVVRLNGITAEPGFFITDAFVGVFDGETGERLVTLGQFFDSYPGQYQETGYLQVFYSRGEVVSLQEQQESLTLPAPNEGFEVIDTDGMTEGDNTHTMLFNYVAEDPTTMAKYRLYADDGSRGSSYDALVSTADPSFEIRDIAEANVAGNLIPLPAALGPGLFGLAVVGFVKRMRRVVVA